MRRKFIGGILAALVVVVVVVLIVQSFAGGSSNTPKTPAAQATHLTTITGVIGSEKADFFADPAVQKIFKAHGLNVKVESAGSREIATTVNLKNYDFAFPASAPAAVKIQQKMSGTTAYSPFYSPMVIATYAPIMQLLGGTEVTVDGKKVKVATKDANNVWHIDMAAYLNLVASDTRWKALPNGASLYNSPRTVGIDSTDIRKSNSAAMYLAIASYVLNGDNVVSSKAQEDKVIDSVSKLFISQGYSGSSSSEPFEDYLTQGIGAVPMVMLYESQFVGEAASPTSRITKDMVLAYPDPTVFSKHTLLAFNANSNKVGKLLTSDKGLIKLEAEHGFRTSDTAAFNATVKAHKVTVDTNLTNIAEVPAYDTLESMIVKISDKYNQ